MTSAERAKRVVAMLDALGLSTETVRELKGEILAFAEEAVAEERERCALLAEDSYYVVCSLRTLEVGPIKPTLAARARAMETHIGDLPARLRGG